MTVHRLEKRAPISAVPVAGGPSPSAPRRQGLRTALTVAAIMGLIGAGAGAWILLRPPEVLVGEAERGQAVDAIYASGVVEYVRQARIAPVVTAPIRQVLVLEGQAVKPGQVLAQLDDGPQEGTTLQLEAQADLARAEARRTERLYLAGFAAPASHEDAQKRRAAAEAAARSARARLADYRLAAPFAGRVLRREAEPGDLAAVGTPLFVVADPSALRVRADVDERDIGRLAIGLDAIVRSDAFPDRTFPARVAEITPQGDATGRIFRVRLSLGGDTPLRPGMTVATNLIIERREHAVLVPTKAIADGAVWTIDGERARRRPVRLGAQGPQRSEVAAGLAPGARVILNPPADLKDGARVKIANGDG